MFTEQVLPRLLCAPAELLLDALPPLQPQTRFLEIDAAGGVVARPLVERIAGLGRLVTLDEDLREVANLPAGARRAARAVGKASALPFAAGAFDVAIANLVLGDSHDDGPRLAELRRVLRPGAWLLATVILRGSWEELLDVVFDAAESSNLPRVAAAVDEARSGLPDAATLRTRVADAGFAVSPLGLEERVIAVHSGASLVDDALINDVVLPALLGMSLPAALQLPLLHATDVNFPAGLPLRVTTGLVTARVERAS